MAKAAGDACNLACRYCYYLGKGQTLYPHHPTRLMSDEVLEEYVRQYIASAQGGDVLFTWHGGEPLLRPLAFYRKAVELQQRYASAGQHIDNALQTNGTLINTEWADFLATNGWLVGVSIDGPQDMHDHYRHTRPFGDASGFGSHELVLRGINMLKERGVMWNAMAVVTRETTRRPLDFYRYFRDELQCQYLQFTPETESENSAVADKEYGAFLCAIFSEWVKHDVGHFFVQMFDSTLAGWVGAMPGVCSMAPVCGHAAALEWNGDLYACDHFVDARHRLGNIMQRPIGELMSLPQQRQVGAAKMHGLSPVCQRCRWRHLCHGGCPKDRDRNGRNILCEGLAQYFEYSADKFLKMAQLLSQNRDASEVMLDTAK